MEQEDKKPPHILDVSLKEDVEIIPVEVAHKSSKKQKWGSDFDHALLALLKQIKEGQEKAEQSWTRLEDKTLPAETPFNRW